MVEQGPWQALLAKLDAAPPYVIWNAAEPVRVFRHSLGRWEKAAEFTEQVIALVIEYASHPAGHDHWFAECLSVIYDDYGAMEGPLNFYQLCNASQVLGLELIGRLKDWGLLSPQQKLLYRFHDMISDDIVLRKVNLTELEAMYE